MFCDEFILVDLRVFDNCKKVCEGCEHVFNLAADMGGMGFIQSNHSVIMYNNTMISFNMIEAARQTDVKRCAWPNCTLRRTNACIARGHAQMLEGIRNCGSSASLQACTRAPQRLHPVDSGCIDPTVPPEFTPSAAEWQHRASADCLPCAHVEYVVLRRFFYASSACIYPEGKQLDTKVEGGGLKEADAWPAQPQDAYGLEKLASEEICKHYDTDFGIACRIARFHNIYGPYGTWKGGREKAPAAFCRKAICAQVLAAACGLPACCSEVCDLLCDRHAWMLFRAGFVPRHKPASQSDAGTCLCLLT